MAGCHCNDHPAEPPKVGFTDWIARNRFSVTAEQIIDVDGNPPGKIMTALALSIRHAQCS
jgi:hypothetical protein